MLSIQEMLDIASRYRTTMADAMVAACAGWAVLTATPLVFGRHGAPTRRAEKRPVEAEPDWELMVRCNSDARAQHV